MKPDGPGNLDLWRKYGDYVLMAMPYADEVLSAAILREWERIGETD